MARIINIALSSSLALFYVVGIFIHSTRPELPKVLLGLSAFLVLSLACIWFGDELGSRFDPLSIRGFNNPSPGWMVALLGWIILLLPVAIPLLQCLQR
jgi:hypothetical protein